MRKILVAGASGLIGGHLVRSLLEDGFFVRAVGRGEFSTWRQLHAEAENIVLNLSLREQCERAVESIDSVYNLAAEIGGVNFIEKNKAQTMLSVLTNTHLLQASKKAGVNRYFYASTDAVTAAEIPQEGKALTDVIEDGHIWEKLFSEKLCKYFREDYGLQTRIGRLQNVYGPYDAYDGGKERAPGALCRKAVLAKASGNHRLEIWGDGMQIRNFLFVKDAVREIRKCIESDDPEPVRIGSNERITINELVDAVEAAAGIHFERIYNTHAPRGTERKFIADQAGHRKLDLTPTISLTNGVKELYDWVENDMRVKGLI